VLDAESNIAEQGQQDKGTGSLSPCPAALVLFVLPFSHYYYANMSFFTKIVIVNVVKRNVKTGKNGVIYMKMCVRFTHNMEKNTQYMMIKISIIKAK